MSGIPHPDPPALLTPSFTPTHQHLTCFPSPSRGLLLCQSQEHAISSPEPLLCPDVTMEDSCLSQQVGGFPQGTW